MFGLGIPELVIILGVAAVVLFSGEKDASDLAKGLGKFTEEFKKGKDAIESELKKSDLTKEVGKFVGEFKKGKDIANQIKKAGKDLIG